MLLRVALPKNPIGHIPTDCKRCRSSRRWCVQHVNHPVRFLDAEVVEQSAVEADGLGTDATSSALYVVIRERRKKRS